jgi:hypothetical protein
MFLPFGVAAFICPRSTTVIHVSSGNYSQAFPVASVFDFVGVGPALLPALFAAAKKECVANVTGPKDII